MVQYWEKCCIISFEIHIQSTLDFHFGGTSLNWTFKTHNFSNLQWYCYQTKTVEKIILNSTIHDSLFPNTVLKSNKNHFYLAYKISGENDRKIPINYEFCSAFVKRWWTHLTLLTITWEWQCYKCPLDLDMWRTSGRWDHRRWHTRAIRAIETFTQD